VKESAEAPRPVGRPRDPHVDQAVLEATFAMLAEVGYDGVTIEAVAHAAGVSKNAIYRRWPDVEDLFLEAFHELTRCAVAPAPTGDLRADLEAFARDYAGELNRPTAEYYAPSNARVISETINEACESLAHYLTDAHWPDDAGGMRAEIRSVRAVSAWCSAELMIRPIRFADGGSISSSRQCPRSSSRTRSG